jgi:hypothetical protein
VGEPEQGGEEGSDLRTNYWVLYLYITF